MSWTFWLEGVSIPLISSFGLLGNLCTVWVLSSNRARLDLSSSFTSLLICLAVYDFFFLLFACLVYSVPAFIAPLQSTLQIHAVPFLIPCTNICLTGSVYSVIAITLERFSTLRTGGLRVSSRAFIMAISLFAVGYNIVKFFELTVIEVTYTQPNQTTDLSIEMKDNESIQLGQRYEISPTWLRRHPVYSLNYIVVSNIIVMSILPALLLSIVNYLIYKKISSANRTFNQMSSRHRREKAMITILASIVLVFLTSHSTRAVLNIYEAIQMVEYGTISYWPPWADRLTRWSHLMLVTNSSCNILIYVLQDFKFRRALWEHLTCSPGGRGNSGPVPRWPEEGRSRSPSSRNGRGVAPSVLELEPMAAGSIDTMLDTADSQKSSELIMPYNQF